LQFLETLSRGELPPQEAPAQSATALFESRCADAFQALGFDITRLGQGHGRAPDFLATVPRFRYGIIVDAKSRREAYVLRTDDRTFFEYVANFCSRLKNEGIEKSYLAIVASAFRDSDLKKLAEYLAGSDIRGITFFTARALARVVEESIRNRLSFTLGEFEKLLFSNRIIAA
jgi:hypothetical protein